MGDAGAKARNALFSGQITGEVWEWSPENGWRELPGTEGAGPNGIEASPDGRWLYIAEWGAKRILRFSYEKDPGRTASRNVTAALDFYPNNLRWQQGGTLATAGFSGELRSMFEECVIGVPSCPTHFTVAATIDPATSKVRKLVDRFPSTNT